MAALKRSRRLTFCYASTLALAFLVVQLHLLSSNVSTDVFVMGQQEQEQNELVSYTMEELQQLSNQQLEDICIQRGFELLKDEENETTGEVYQLTHDDYVEAAMKCLAIEQEMNELLTQYPELAEELEEEIKKMEAENAAKQAELDEMQQRLSHTNRQPPSEGPAAINERDGSPSAFVPKSNADESPLSESETTSTLPPQHVDDLKMSEEEDVATINEYGDDLEEGEKGDAADGLNTEPLSTESTSTVATDVADPSAGASSSSHREDFTVSNLAIESLRAFIMHAKDDVKRILELVVPVMRPLLTAGDVAWRQIKALFVRARDAYYESAPSADDGSSSDEEEQEAAATEGEDLRDNNSVQLP